MRLCPDQEPGEKCGLYSERHSRKGGLKRSSHHANHQQARYRLSICSCRRTALVSLLGSNSASSVRLDMLCQAHLSTPESSGAAAPAPGGSEVEVCSRQEVSLSQQDPRAGSSRDQTPMCLHAGLQIVWQCSDHARWHRAGISDSQATILAWPGSSVAETVSYTVLGPGSRFSLICEMRAAEWSVYSAASAPERRRRS